MEKCVEADVTVNAILQAERKVRKSVGYGADTPLVILGGSGFIGSRLVKRLEGRDVYTVDTASKKTSEWPDQLRGEETILINVASRTALQEYLDLIWPGLVLLNEVYPEPSRQERKAFSELGNSVYHVAGLKANSYPPFPKAYAGGIPCCAGWKSDNMQAQIRELDA